eukprot:Plantae.Rhodophyta-Hildenbrandia_rubra.ctg25717.p3 GENE.Plantae.Rhodophyta-Hildenbrandia_rubra.ctg25717~~Plantae.Rhodophyta-Hildenbrandia_rubra.ctg25717.p3  ORF type:complete len:144 (-),score=32.27 Plantae.Rhodophyta-Hildenbrandia_rubra.ctg25717:1117-1548(-)
MEIGEQAVSKCEPQNDDDALFNLNVGMGNVMSMAPLENEEMERDGYFAHPDINQTSGEIVAEGKDFPEDTNQTICEGAMQGEQEELFDGAWTNEQEQYSREKIEAPDECPQAHANILSASQIQQRPGTAPRRTRVSARSIFGR